MRPKIIRMVLKDGVARASVKKKQFVPVVPPPGAPTFTIDTPIPVSVYFASVDNYVLTIDPADDILSNTYVTFVNGTGNFTQTDVYANVYLDGVPVPGYQDIKLNKTTSTDIDFRNSGLLQDQYQLKYYARHLNTNAVPELTGEKSIETTSSNELYTLAELPPGITGAPGLMDPVPIIGAGAVAPPYTASESTKIFDSDFYGVARIFDNSGTDSSHTKDRIFDNLGADSSHWYRVDFQDPYVVTSYKLWGHFDAATPDLPVDYGLQGSNDGGATWTAVDTQVNNPPPTTDAFPANAWVSGGETIPHLTLPVANPGAYLAYRFNCTKETPRNILRIRELQLIGYAAYPGMSLLPVIDTSVESRFILPACGFSSGNWTGSYTYLDGITSVPVEPIGPGGPFDDLRSTIGFYTSPSYLPQDLDPVAHPGPGQALISYDKTLTKTVDVQNIGTYYVRITSRLENNFAGFDGLGPVRTDDFQLDALVPIITSPLLTAAIMDINPEYSLEFLLPNLSVQLPSTWQWTDGTGTFEAGQEELEVLFYKVSSFGQLPNFGDLAGQISGFYNGTGQSYKGDASDAGLTVQGYYRIGTRIRHRNVTLGVDGGWSNIIVDDDTYVHTLGPTITAVNQQARDNDNEGILIASGTTFDFVDGDYAPVDIDISTGRLVFLQFEIHSDPGFTSKLFGGQMAVLGQNVATGVGTFYVRYKLSYVHVDDSGSTSAPSAWFPDPAGAITVVEPVITAPTITNFPDLDFSNFNNADSVPSLNVSASWSWTDGTGIFTNDEEELEMLFYKVPYEDQSPNEYPILGSDPADLNSPDATVSGLLYSSSGYDGVLAQAGLTVQGLYRVGFRIRHRHISSGRTGDWSSIELLSQTLYYTLDPVINSVSSGAYVDVNHKLVLPALLDFVNSIGNYNPSDPEVDLHNFYYTEYEVHGNASFTDLKLQGEVTGTVSLDTDGGYNYIRYRTFIKNIVFITNPTWGYLYVNSKYSAWVSDTSNPVMVPYAFDSASLSPVTTDYYLGESGAVVESVGVEMHTGNVSDVYSVTPLPGFANVADTFTYILPLYKTADVIGSDKFTLTIGSTLIGSPTTEFLIDYGNSPPLFKYTTDSGQVTSSQLPAKSTNWHKERHALVLTYDGQTQNLFAYLYYMYNGGTTVGRSSFDTTFNSPYLASPSRDITFGWSGGSPTDLILINAYVYDTVFSTADRNALVGDLILPENMPGLWIDTSSDPEINFNTTEVKGTAGAPNASTTSVGYEGLSLSFNNPDSALVTNYPGISGNQNLSFTFWILHRSLDPVTTAEQSIFMAGTASMGQAIGLNRVASDNSLKVYVFGSNATTTAGTFPPDTYIHVGVTYDGTKIRLYVNGQFNKSYTPTNPLNLPFSPDVIVGWDGYFNTESQGLRMNRFRMFDTTLDASDVFADYQIARTE